MNIADILVQHALEIPGSIAIEYRSKMLNYEQLYRQVVGVERHLREMGVNQGDVVGVMLSNTANHIVVLFALAKLGAVILGIDGSLPDPEREKAIDSLDVKVVIAGSPVPIIPGVSVLNITVFPPAPKGSPIATGGSMFEERSPLMVVQSSDATGKPKNIILSHESFRARILEHERSVGTSEPDRLYLMLEMDSGSRRRSMATIYLGGTVVLSSTKDTGKCVREIVDRGITWVALTPALVNEFLKHANGSAPVFPSLKMMTVTGSRIARDVRSRARELLCSNLVERYETNEVGLLAIAFPADQETYPESVGKIVDSVEAQVVDEDLIPLPFGEVGRVRFRASYFPTAYSNIPDTAAKVFRDGWYYPGDLAKINGEGYLFLKGRVDDVINNDGARFYPLEVENVLMAHTAVVEAAVVGRHYDDNRQVAVAFVVLNSHTAVRELKDYCDSRLASYKTPMHFEFVGEIPKSPQGKVLKKELKEHFQKTYLLTREEARWSGDPL